MEQKKYVINDKVYHQKKLVTRQVKQLIGMLAGYVFTDISATGIIETLGDSFSRVAAIILIPEGVKIKNKNIDALADEFDENFPFELIPEVVNDFLAFNPISSISSSWRNMMGRMTAVVKGMAGEGSDIESRENG